MSDHPPAIAASETFGSHVIEIYSDDTVCFRVRGDLSLEDVTHSGAYVEGHVDVLRAPLLLDISGLDRVGPGVIQRTRKLKRFCVAVFVHGFEQRALYAMVPHLFGEKPPQPTRFFVNEDAARAWATELRTAVKHSS